MSNLNKIDPQIFEFNLSNRTNTLLLEKSFFRDKINIENAENADYILENSDSQKLLGVTIDRKLNFKEHVTNLCDKASKQIQTLARIFLYMPQTQSRLLKNAYCMSQFGYCPLVWMNHSRTLNGLH